MILFLDVWVNYSPNTTKNFLKLKDLHLSIQQAFTLNLESHQALRNLPRSVWTTHNNRQFALSLHFSLIRTPR